MNYLLSVLYTCICQVKLQFILCCSAKKENVTCNNPR